MKRSTFRGAAIGLSAVVVTALAVAGASPALAAPNQYAPSIGTATGTAVTTPVNVPVAIKTSALCPTGSGVVNGFMNSTDAAIVDAVVISANSTDLANLTTSGMPLDNNLLGLAAAAGKVLVNGRYEVSVVCFPDAFSAPTAQFDAAFTVTGGANATAPGTSATWDVAAAPASSTNLTVSPASPQALGTSVTLTAAVTSTAPVAGTVQFRSGTTALGAPVAVSGGSAVLTTTTLPAGTQQLTAEFIPTNPAVVAGSTSAPLPFTITAPAQATTTTLSSSPAAPTTADVVSLSAAVSVASGTVGTGTVTFNEVVGSTPTPVGTANVSGGSASVSVTGLSAGTHTYTATYAGNAAFLTSTSAPITVTVTTFTGASASESITTTVNAGALTITAGGTVDLGALALNTANTLLVSQPKDINTVTVTDTRAGNLGWTVNGAVTDFAGPGTAQINSENLGWTPRVVSQLPVQNVTAGNAVPPGAGVAVGATTGAGIKSGKLLASAAAGGSLGTAELTAALVLQAPTSTTPGTYNATLTLTAL
ncbi:MAG: Ig-like domain repeat protein [Kineosporiaceae bacterium]